MPSIYSNWRSYNEDWNPWGNIKRAKRALLDPNPWEILSVAFDKATLQNPEIAGPYDTYRTWIRGKQISLQWRIGAYDKLLWLEFKRLAAQKLEINLPTENDPINMDCCSEAVDS
jgi:hypothetical protein